MNNEQLTMLGNKIKSVEEHFDSYKLYKQHVINKNLEDENPRVGMLYNQLTGISNKKIKAEKTFIKTKKVKNLISGLVAAYNSIKAELADISKEALEDQKRHKIIMKANLRYFKQAIESMIEMANEICADISSGPKNVTLGANVAEQIKEIEAEIMKVNKLEDLLSRSRAVMTDSNSFAEVDVSANVGKLPTVDTAAIKKNLFANIDSLRQQEELRIVKEQTASHTSTTTAVQENAKTQDAATTMQDTAVTEDRKETAKKTTKETAKPKSFLDLIQALVKGLKKLWHKLVDAVSSLLSKKIKASDADTITDQNEITTTSDSMPKIEESLGVNNSNKNSTNYFPLDDEDDDDIDTTYRLDIKSLDDNFKVKENKPLTKEEQEDELNTSLLRCF